MGEAGLLDVTWGDMSFNTDKGGDCLKENGQQKKKQRRELQMNWHICKYLPMEESCQSCFQVSMHHHRLASRIQCNIQCHGAVLGSPDCVGCCCSHTMQYSVPWCSAG